MRSTHCYKLSGSVEKVNVYFIKNMLHDIRKIEYHSMEFYLFLILQTSFVLTREMREDVR